MSGGSKSTSSQQEQQTATNTLAPDYKNQLLGNLTTAQNNAASLLPYTGSLTAGFTPTQTTAQNKVNSIANDPTYGATNNAATSSITGVMNNPVQVVSQLNGNVTATPVSANNVTAGQLSSTDLSPYLHPYTQDVINTTISDQERARQIQAANDARQATAQGAFGGSRSGVQGALTNEAYDRNTSSLLAGLNQSNYTNAQSAAQQDIANRLAADTTNAGNNLNASEYNSGQNLTAQQNSFANNLAANNQTFNQGVAANTQTLDAANQLQAANNNALNTATNQAGLLSSVGDAQQQQAQTELNNLYNNWMQGNQLTIEKQQMLNQALGLIPNQQTLTTNGSSTGTETTSSNSGLTGMLGGLGSLAMGLGKQGLGVTI